MKRPETMLVQWSLDKEPPPKLLMGTQVSPGFPPTSGHIGELVCIHSDVIIKTSAMYAEYYAQGISKIHN